jgi:hypothetical protein
MDAVDGEAHVGFQRLEPSPIGQMCKDDIALVNLAGRQAGAGTGRKHMSDAHYSHGIQRLSQRSARLMDS